METIASYPISKDDPVLSHPSDEIIAIVKEAARKPLEILDYFREFSSLIDKSPSYIIKKLFAEKAPSISYYDKEEIQ